MKLLNTERFLTAYVNKLIKLTKEEIEKPRTRNYKSGTITSPLDSSGSLKNSLLLKKKYKDTISSKGFNLNRTYNVIGNYYGEILDEGADGSKIKATQEGIEKWIDTKPVKLKNITNKSTVASLIKEKLNREGIKPTRFLTDLIDKQFDNILGVGPEIIKDINLNIDDILILLGYEKKGNTFIKK